MKRVNTTSGALRAAKKYLWKGDGSWSDFTRDPDKLSYICDSISSAYYEGHITHKAKIAAVKTVMSRLCPHVSVGQWLEHNVGYRIKFGREHDTYNKQVQAYRHRWLDALIIEFETKGD